MLRTVFLLVTAIGEGVTGLLLLLWPAVPMALLLGVDAPATEAILTARVAGAAIISIAATSGMARSDGGGQALRAVLTGFLIYDVAIVVLLAYAGIGLGMTGILLWPAVVAHAALAIWCVRCLLVAEQPMRADAA